MDFTIKPERLIPVSEGGRIKYVNMTGRFNVTMRSLTEQEVRELGDRLIGVGDFKSIEASANVAPDAPSLPREFQRRLEID